MNLWFCCCLGCWVVMIYVVNSVVHIQVTFAWLLCLLSDLLVWLICCVVLACRLL